MAFKKIRTLSKPVVLLIAWLINMVGKTFRVEIIDKHNHLETNGAEASLYLIWHNRLFGIIPLTPAPFRKKTAVLISRSRDGGYITDIAAAFGCRIIRGSSSRGGAKALIELKKHIEAKGSILLTPDGPRGPKYQLQDGVVWVASKTGAPIIPVMVNTEKHWELKGWDKTQIPRPFTKAELIIGDPIYIDKDLDETRKREYRESIQAQMMAMTRWD